MAGVGRWSPHRVGLACCCGHACWFKGCAPARWLPTRLACPCSGLRSLVVEDLHCHLYKEPLAELGRLTQVGRRARVAAGGRRARVAGARGFTRVPCRRAAQMQVVGWRACWCADSHAMHASA